jgi:acyl-CoA synthetase (AMP-forming)/AMP-acid ligase II
MEFVSEYGAVAFHDAEHGLTLCEPGAWVGTGDHASRADDGHWELAGRANQIFKRYGEKIALGQLLDTVGSAWKGQAHFYREQDGMSEEGYVLVLSPEPAPADVRAVLAGFRSRHPRTHWPLRVEGIDDLPVLPNGKVDLETLPSQEGKTVHWRNPI